MKSYIVKENHIGPAFSEILWYRQKDILLLLLKDKKKFNNIFVFRCIQETTRVPQLHFSKILIWVREPKSETRSTAIVVHTPKSASQPKAFRGTHTQMPKSVSQRAPEERAHACATTMNTARIGTQASSSQAARHPMTKPPEGTLQTDR